MASPPPPPALASTAWRAARATGEDSGFRNMSGLSEPGNHVAQCSRLSFTLLGMQRHRSSEYIHSADTGPRGPREPPEAGVGPAGNLLFGTS